MITRIEKVTLYVDSQEEAKRFWTEKLGFIVVFEQEMAPGMKWIEIAPKGENLTSLVLYSKQAMLQTNPQMVAHPSIIFAATDIDAVWQDLKTKGVAVTPVQALPYGNMFNFNDNDGNLYMVRG